MTTATMDNEQRSAQAKMTYDRALAKFESKEPTLDTAKEFFADCNFDLQILRDLYDFMPIYKRIEHEAVSYTHLTLPTTPYV